MDTYGYKSSAFIINPTVAVEVFSRSIELTIGWLKWYVVLTFKRRTRGRTR